MSRLIDDGNRTRPIVRAFTEPRRIGNFATERRKRHKGSIQAALDPLLGRPTLARRTNHERVVGHVGNRSAVGGPCQRSSVVDPNRLGLTTQPDGFQAMRLDLVQVDAPVRDHAEPCSVRRESQFADVVPRTGKRNRRGFPELCDHNGVIAIRVRGHVRISPDARRHAQQAFQVLIARDPLDVRFAYPREVDITERIPAGQKEDLIGRNADRMPVPRGMVGHGNRLSRRKIIRHDPSPPVVRGRVQKIPAIRRPTQMTVRHTLTGDLQGSGVALKWIDQELLPLDDGQSRAVRRIRQTLHFTTPGHTEQCGPESHDARHEPPASPRRRASLIPQ